MSAVADFDPSDLLDYCVNGDEGISAPESDSDEQSPPFYHGAIISPQTWLETSVQYIRWCDRLLTEGIAPEGMLYYFNIDVGVLLNIRQVIVHMIPRILRLLAILSRSTKKRRCSNKRFLRVVIGLLSTRL